MPVNHEDKQFTLADVAARANVSIKTVSRVINNEPYVGTATRERVAQAIQELNYHPNRAARRLASKRSHVIGMLVPSIDYPIFPMIILGVEKVMHAHNYEVLVYNTEVAPERTRKGLELLEENQVDGVMVFTVNHISDDELQQLISRQRSAVLVNTVLPGSDAGVVRIDVVRGIELLVQHLLEAGKRRIALLTYPKINYSATERLRGYKQAMTRFDMPIDDDLIIVCEDSLDAVYHIVQEHLKNGSQIDAFVCYNDLMAATVLKACLDLNVPIPEQVAVTGFDNIPFTDLFKCPLTTVNIPWLEVGISAAEMLLSQISGEPTTTELVFTPELVVRESTP
ncbi:MAG: hypothetical protein CL610_10115 [Anaerolineaceae bacterium]|nr:hypothetical protein [Anaerolineaceae bacterium]